jgi:hypothetical protein
MAEIVNGIFGIDPQLLAQQRQATDMAQAYKYASLAPSQQAQFGAYLGGSQLGRGAINLMGGDTEMQKVSQIQQLSTQFDLTTSTGMREFARALQQIAPQEAMMAAKRADEMTQAGLTQVKTQSEIAKNLREKSTPASSYGKLIQERQQLLDGGMSPNDPIIQGYNAKIQADEKGSGTKIDLNLGSVFTEMFTKQDAKAQAEAWDKAGIAYSDTAGLSRTLNTMESLVGNAFVGPYGNLAKNLSSALGGSEKLDNTQILDALSAQLVIPLVKQFPGSLAVKELQELIKTKPNIAQSEGTIRRLLATIQQDVRASQLVYEAGEKHRAKNKGKIEGFNPYIAKAKATRLAELQSIYRQKKQLTPEQVKESQKLVAELNMENE